MRHFVMPGFLLLFGLVLLSGCNAAEDLQADQSELAATISCEVFYRPTNGGTLETSPVTPLSRHNDQQVNQFKDLMFTAQYQVDQFEGHALYISIVDRDSGSEFSRQLFQFDNQNPVENQFIGGHGFTGLNYVYHPTSTSEMQYFCSVQ